MSDESIDRRRFLLAIAATAAAATATGAGAALLKSKDAVTPPPVQLPPVVSNTQAVVNSAGEMSDLAAQLISSQADNIRLQAELDAALRRVAAIDGANGNSGSTIENLQSELVNAGNQIGILSGLVALYEQLDDVDLGALLSSGLESVEGAFDDLTDDLPTIQEGLAFGQQALQQLESELPFMAQARNWLDTQMGRMGGFYSAVLVTLANVADEAGDFLQMLGRWFTDVLAWLPFGMGDNAIAIMNALTELLGETSTTVMGYNNNAGSQLDKWLKPDQVGGPMPLQANLIHPIREGALTPASNLASKAALSKATFKTALSEPAGLALINQTLLKEQIASYRTAHKIDRKGAA